MLLDAMSIDDAPAAAFDDAGLSIRGEVAALKKQRILEEASRLFFEKGYDGSTLEALAKRMNVTKPFIYTYYKGKADLLAAICETGIQESILAVDRAMAQETRALDQLKAAVAGAARAVIRFQNCVVVYQREMKALDRRDAQRILQQRHHFDRQLILLLERAAADGEVTVADPAMTSVWIGGLISWIPVWYMPGGRRKEADVVAELVDAVMRLVAAAQVRS